MKRLIVMTAVLGLVLAACSTTRTVASGPGLKVTVPSSVQGNVVDLELVATGISIVKADGDTSGKTGHYHVFVDREPVAPGALIPREPGIVHSAASPVKVTGLGIGRHKIAIVFGDGAHRRIGSSLGDVTVDVKGPTVSFLHASSGPVAAGKSAVVAVSFAGVTLVKADGDTSGKTGHLHVFIDREPTPAGRAIPKEAGIIHTADTTITIPALAAGEHTIWVVLGNGVHVPFASPVLDKVTVTVA